MELQGRPELQIESRVYNKSTMWVFTSVLADSNVAKTWWLRMWYNYEGKMFQKLFRYIDGNNARKQEIKMTAPVLIRFEDNYNGKMNISMWFYVAIDNPPMPTEADVMLYRSKPGQKALVRTFQTDWYTFPWYWDNNVAMLKKGIQAAASEMPGRFFKVNPGVFYHVGYDQPFKFMGKIHNEVWMEAMEESAGSRK